MRGSPTPDAVGSAPAIPEQIREVEGPVVDLGCGSGRLLGALREAGLSAFGVEREADRVAAARAAGFEVLWADLGDLPAERPAIRAACLVSVLTALPLRQARRAALDALCSWVPPGGRAWIRDFQRWDESPHQGSPRARAYERRYALGPTLASRLWGAPAEAWVEATFVAFRPGSQAMDASRFEEHRYSAEEFLTAVSTDVIRADFPACHLSLPELSRELEGFTLLSARYALAPSRSGAILPVLDAVFERTHGAGVQQGLARGAQRAR